MSHGIKAILFSPKAEHYNSLFNGPLGYRAPSAFRGDTCPHHNHWEEYGEWRYRDCYMCKHPQWAVVSFWDGELVCEGMVALGTAIDNWYREQNIKEAIIQVIGCEQFDFGTAFIIDENDDDITDKFRKMNREDLDTFFKEMECQT